jgi:hypothetical protein
MSDEGSIADSTVDASTTIGDAVHGPLDAAMDGAPDTNAEGAVLPACDDGKVGYGICFTVDTDILPITGSDSSARLSTDGLAIITDSGTGTPPGNCENARWFGAKGATEWWLQAKAADGHVWVLGMHGVGAMQPLKKGDTSRLTLQYRGEQIGGFGPPSVSLQLFDPMDAPLLWAYTNNSLGGTTWINLKGGSEVCLPFGFAPHVVRDVTVTIGGATVTIPPFGSADVGGFRVQIGKYVDGINPSIDDYGESFDLVAAKLP